MTEYGKFVERDGSPTFNFSFKKNYVYGLVLNACLGSFFFGYILSVFNPMLTFIQNGGAFDKTIPDIIVLFMTSFVSLGAGVGALAAGKTAAHIGRRKTMMITDIIAIFGTTLTLLPFEYALLIGRLIQGYCIGSNSSLVPLYINEVTPAEIRGSLGTYNQIFISMGIVTAPIIGLGMPDDDTVLSYGSQFFRIMLLVASVPAFIRLFVLLFIFKSETPSYLISQGKEEEAKQILENIYNEARAQDELIALKKLQEEKTRNQLTLKDIFSPLYSRRLLIGVFVSILQQCSGINAIGFFSNSIFGGSGTTPTLYTVIMDVVQVATCFIAGLVIEKYGRKLLFLAGMSYVSVLLAAFGLTTLFVSESPVLKFFIWAYMIGFGLAVGPIPWIYISDILPDVGIGLAALTNWASAFIIGLGFKPLTEVVGMGWSFLIFAITSAMGTAFAAIMMKETKNKTPEEIATMFSNATIDGNSTLSNPKVNI